MGQSKYFLAVFAQICSSEKLGGSTFIVSEILGELGKSQKKYILEDMNFFSQKTYI